MLGNNIINYKKKYSVFIQNKVNKIFLYLKKSDYKYKKHKM